MTTDSNPTTFSDTPFSDVLVPLDGNESSTRALGIATELALEHQARLQVVAYATPEDETKMVDSVSRQVAAAALPIEPSITVEPRTTFVPQLLRATYDRLENPLIVMASHGRNRSALYFGSVTSEVLAAGLGPVVLVGPNVRTDRYHLKDGGPFVVALDGTTESESILEVAETWAVELGRSLEVVTVLDPKQLASIQELDSGDLFESSYVQRQAEKAAAVTATIADFEVLHDSDPARAIVNEATARNACLVAMATHASTGIELLRHKSVTADVVRNATMPVLAIHT